jgi:catalase
MSDWEQQHIAEAFSFELNQVESEEVRHHVMNELLVNIADALAEAVSTQTGIKVAPLGTPKKPTPSAPTPSGPLRLGAKELSSPALSQDKPSLTIKGRKIALLGGEGVDAQQLKAVKDILTAQDALFELIAAHAGTITDSAGRPQKVSRAAPNAPSVVYDAVVVLGGASAAVLAESGGLPAREADCGGR